MSTSVQDPQELASADGYAGCVAVPVGMEVLVVYMEVVVTLASTVEAVEPDPDVF